jgi:hypothetical protein
MAIDLEDVIVWNREQAARYESEYQTCLTNDERLAAKKMADMHRASAEYLAEYDYLPLPSQED